MTEAIREAIEQTARGPARVSVDGTSVDAQRISDLIEADKHLAGNTALTRNHLGIRFRQIIPPGGG